MERTVRNVSENGRVSLPFGALASAITAAALLASIAASVARADVITEWNAKACDLLSESRMAPPAANRVMAIVQVSAFEAVNAITRRYPVHDLDLKGASGASVDAAVAAAHRAVLTKLLPEMQPAVDSICGLALGRIADGPGRTAGIRIGEAAAAGILARQAEALDAGESYRPHTSPGVYVPTIIPIALEVPKRKPWLMKSCDQFRPGPPPPLQSERWARDYNEIKEIGSKNSARRTAEQTAVARFWEATGAAIYQGVLRSVADRPGRDVTQNARLFAAATQAGDDALTAVFDGKYHYNFWRPVTAIRNGDIDGNDATERDSTWTPFISTPMHPEYPCAHCVVSGAIGTVLEEEIGSDPSTKLSTSSPTAGGAVRSWSNVEEFIQEVANARIYDGVHFRTSTEVGTDLGRKVGALAVAKYLHPVQ